MKKTVSAVLAVLFIAASLCTAALAGKAVLTKEGVKLIIQASDFVCDMYMTRHFEDYSDVIFFDVAELFPEAVVDSYEGEPERITATLDQIKAAVKNKWRFMTDKSIDELFMKDFDHHCRQTDGTYELILHAHGGDITFNEGKKGVFMGYTSEEGGIFNAYYKVYCAEECVDDYLGAGADKFWEKAAGLGFPGKVKYGYDTYVSFEGEYYRAVPRCRIFTFQLYDGGRAGFTEDGWRAFYPPDLSFIGGDINGDGDADNKDVFALFRYLSTDDGSEINNWAADVNADYAADNKDVVSLFRYCSGDVSIEPSTTPHSQG